MARVSGSVTYYFENLEFDPEDDPDMDLRELAHEALSWASASDGDLVDVRIDDLSE